LAQELQTRRPRRVIDSFIATPLSESGKLVYSVDVFEHEGRSKNAELLVKLFEFRQRWCRHLTVACSKALLDLVIVVQRGVRENFMQALPFISSLTRCFQQGCGDTFCGWRSCLSRGSKLFDDDSPSIQAASNSTSA